MISNKYLNIAKLGVLPADVFFEILQLNGFNISKGEQQRILHKCKGQTMGGVGGWQIKYHEALTMVNHPPQANSQPGGSSIHFDSQMNEIDRDPIRNSPMQNFDNFNSN